MFPLQWQRFISDSHCSFKPSGWLLSLCRLILNLKTSYSRQGYARESVLNPNWEIKRLAGKKVADDACSIRIWNIFREAHCFVPSLISSLVSVSPSLGAKWWLSTSEIIHKTFFFSILEWFYYCLNSFCFSVSSHYFLLVSSFFASFFITLLRPSLSFQHLVPLFPHSNLSFPF